MISYTEKRLNHGVDRGASYGMPFAPLPSFFLREDPTIPRIFRSEIFTGACAVRVNEPELSQSG